MKVNKSKCFLLHVWYDVTAWYDKSGGKFALSIIA